MDTTIITTIITTTGTIIAAYISRSYSSRKSKSGPSSISTALPAAKSRKKTRTVWIIIIGASLTFVLSVFNLILKAKEKEKNDAFCQKVIAVASEYKQKIEQHLQKDIDNRTRINLLYLKKECNDFSKYSCKSVRSDSVHIATSFRTIDSLLSNQ
ncbi:MAG: hypothetical protein JWQ09_1677 [Segetibacter sp.]|nr:hypothetical protein [Segetibacter sp.]